jgi:hypothetical protein
VLIEQMFLNTHHIIFKICSAFTCNSNILYYLMNFIYIFSWDSFSVTLDIFTFFIIILSAFKVWSFELTRSWGLNQWNFIIFNDLTVFNNVLILRSFWFINFIFLFIEIIVLLINIYISVQFVRILILYQIMISLI